ncbi:MAG TPA: hypothetical protein VFV92_00745 [Candidatus Bathyarchaeia archaeon]|nr:hypothetical protein [Candidatus Bathyarchaeia archaeon]
MTWPQIKPWFDGFVSVVALLTGAYTFYKNFVERAKVSIVPGDRMAIILGPGGARRIHLRGALINDATKMGTLQCLEAKITSPNGTTQRYSWNELVEFVPGTVGVQRAGPPLPIAIPGKDTRPLLTQLELTEQNTRADWTAGRHRVEVLGWVNRKSRQRPANAKCVFHVNITCEQASILPIDQPEHKYEDIQIEEWSA